ncbi:hypothetical protein OO013_13130 [Mangrovivirga sp. M17]|uniref:Lipoprotein n=1 Tax=Mangrovivirga halotolerans TaxID=2993936 RepID=A0ABT3RUK2_9BACT|nr:hypothetical protein [Mangrovivirga halotolerans]MCX2744820.1 hypothetical protein [Mangrovivirga halotolerans]
MKSSGVVSVLITMATMLSCQVNEDEKNKLSEVHDQMEKNELIKISREDIYTKAQEQSIKIGSALKNADQNFSVDSLEELYNAQITFIPFENMTEFISDSNNTKKEIEVIEAYLYQLNNNGELEDNVQYINNDTELTYDFPVNNDSIKGVWHAKVKRKEIILNEIKK